MKTGISTYAVGNATSLFLATTLDGDLVWDWICGFSG